MTPAKTPLELFKIDINRIEEKIKSLPITKLPKLDGILGDAANEIYDTYDYISELANSPDKLKGIKSPKHIKALKELSKQVTAFGNMLWEMEYDSKYMYRLQGELEEMEKEIPKIIEKLKK